MNGGKDGKSTGVQEWSSVGNYTGGYLSQSDFHFMVYSRV